MLVSLKNCDFCSLAESVKSLKELTASPSGTVALEITEGKRLNSPPNRSIQGESESQPASLNWASGKASPKSRLAVGYPMAGDHIEEESEEHGEGILRLLKATSKARLP